MANNGRLIFLALPQTQQSVENLRYVQEKPLPVPSSQATPTPPTTADTAHGAWTTSMLDSYYWAPPAFILIILILLLIFSVAQKPPRGPEVVLTRQPHVL